VFLQLLHRQGGQPLKLIRARVRLALDNRPTTSGRTEAIGWVGAIGAAAGAA
jgi:hypothetical protein